MRKLSKRKQRREKKKQQLKQETRETRREKLRQEKKRLHQYERTIRKRGTITGAFKRGSSTITYTPTTALGNLGERQLLTQLLEPLIKDNKLLDILISTENQTKYVSRLHHMAIIEGTTQTGTTRVICTIKSHATMTIRQFSKKINDLFKTGKTYTISNAYRLLHSAGLTTGNNSVQWNNEENFTINTIAIATTFRPG